MIIIPFKLLSKINHNLGLFGAHACHQDLFDKGDQQQNPTCIDIRLVELACGQIGYRV